MWVSMLDGTIRLVDVTKPGELPDPVIEFDGPPPVVIDDSAHGRLLLSGKDEVSAYDMSGNFIGPTILGPAQTGNAINTVSVTPDGSKFVLSWWYETHLFDATSGELINTPGLPLVVSTVSRNGVGAGSTADGRVLLFDPNTLETLAELPGGLHGYAEFLDISDDGSTLVVWNESDGERIYDVTERTELGDPIPYGDTTLYFALRPDGKQLAVPNGPSGL